jgi:exodeoxyribonuclease V beta subunit
MNDAVSDVRPAAAGQPVALAIALSGSHLIEASAGSGKTFTLVAIFLRLVLEKGLPADQILTVTFTKAATAELRQRIRARLLACRAALDGSVADAFTLALMAGADAAVLKQRIDAAIATFDSAPIYTIHGFAHRALAERAFSAGTAFELELGDTRTVWKQAVRDFWRKKVLHVDASQNISPATHRMMLESMLKKDSPALWLRWLGTVRMARHARIDRPAPFQIVTAEQLEQGHRDMARRWRVARPELEAFLIRHPSLNPHSYNSGTVTRWCGQLSDYFTGPPQLVPLKAFANAFERLSATAMRSKLRPDKPLPQHALLEQLEQYLELLAHVRAGIAGWRALLLVDLFCEVPKAVAERLENERMLGYDDLLVRLDDLLAGPSGQAFAKALRERYRAALIDEFQDTDATQDRIFSKIYPADCDAALFLVGDPKQAIYRFRGADIYTYLAAARRTAQRHALRENYRSSDALIAALNGLYQSHADPFLHRSIVYLPAEPGARSERLLIDHEREHASALEVMVVDHPRGDAAANVEERIRQAADVVASEIANMLTLAAAGRLLLGGRAVSAGDIAVLVNNNLQGSLVRVALRRLGVGAADHSRGSVYVSEEADWLLLTLLAAAEPHRTERVAAALATPLFGIDAHALEALAQDENAWQAQMEAFHHFRELWLRYGVMRLLRVLLAELPGAQRLAASADGERHLTNLFHLGELMHAEGVASRGLLAQLNWLVDQRDAAFEDADEGELRLESDENLVQVMTVHKSKGLEFPVVFVPFMFAARQVPAASTMPIAYHDDSNADQLVIDFGSERYADAMRYAQEETRAEEARLLYVALTRASHRCVVVWDETAPNTVSALTQLILASSDAQLPADRKLVTERLRELSAASSGALVLSDIPRAGARLAAGALAGQLAARSFAGPAIAPWRLASFTSLMQRRVMPREAIEAPDHDQDAQAEAEAESAMADATASGAIRFTFARGAAAGECLHQIFEEIEFRPDLREQRGRIATVLRDHGFLERDAPALSRWIEEVLSTPLGPEKMRLATIAPKAQIREMEFHLPLAGALVRHLAPIARRYGITLPSFSEARLDGFLKGFVDLVVLHQGRYYVIDYKSNWLGASPVAYRGERLEAAMQQGGYHLQYLLYCVALKRWLSWRDSAFDYQRDFGGVFYLFIRGMGISGSGAEPGDGVFEARPSLELIEALDAILAGGAA